MKTYAARVLVEYNFEVDAEDEREAEDYAWQSYADRQYFADVYSVEIEEIEGDDND